MLYRSITVKQILVLPKGIKSRHLFKEMYQFHVKSDQIHRTVLFYVSGITEQRTDVAAVTMHHRVYTCTCTLEIKYIYGISFSSNHITLVTVNIKYKNVRIDMY